MKRGISVWLMTKVVMLIFLTMTFAVIMSFTGLVQQRSVSDSAYHLTTRLKDAIQGLLGIRAGTGTRFIVMPREIPEDSVRATPYTFHILLDEDDDEQQQIYIMIAEGLYGEDDGDEIDNYVTASSFKLEGDYRFNLSYSALPNWDEKDELILNSSIDDGYGEGRINIMRDGEQFRIYPSR